MVSGGKAKGDRAYNIDLDRAICSPEPLSLSPIKIARHQPRLEPGDASVDAEHRQAQPLGERAGIRHHVGAFENDRADAAVAGDGRIAGAEDVALRRGDIE